MKLCNAPAQTPFYRRLWRHVVTPCVDRFICNSQFTARELAALGVPSGKTTTIYETLPHRGARRPLGAREARRVVFAGQIIPPKGLHLLLDAIGMLAARQVEVSLDVIGDLDGWISPVYGAYRDEIRYRASRDDLAGRVRFLGWRDDVIEVMAEAAVHCCPSLPEIRESFGLVVLEAKAAGVPSVVFPSGALVEQVTDGVDGLVCASPTADALAEAIGTFLADPAWLNEAGAAAAKSASRFDQATFARSWWGVITGYWTGAPPAGRRPAPAFGNESYEHPRH
jgi:glycosyltransferase involved in cell wall biosynthesis